MDLYQFSLSPNAKRVRVAAAELGIALELKSLDFAKQENRLPGYLERNPMGKVPTLVDGDYTLWESAGILVYLAQKQGKLMPKDPRGLAEVTRWMVWNARHFENAVDTVAVERALKPMFGGQTDQVRVDAGLKDLERYAPILDKHLTGRDWILGELSIVDIAIATTVEFGQFGQIDWSKYPAINSWFERIRSRPSWKA